MRAQSQADASIRANWAQVIAGKAVGPHERYRRDRSAISPAPAHRTRRIAALASRARRRPDAGTIFNNDVTALRGDDVSSTTATGTQCKASQALAVRLPFERGEYDAHRQDPGKRDAGRRASNCMIVTGPDQSWRGSPGYDGWSFYVHQCVLLAMEGEPVWFGRGQDANGAKRTVFMQHENIVGYPDHYVQSPCVIRWTTSSRGSDRKRAAGTALQHRRRDG